MPQIRKNIVLRKTRLPDEKNGLIRKRQIAKNETLFPEKLKKINTLLENANLTPGK